MRRLVSALCAIILSFTVLAPSPAQADPLYSDYTHWGQDCPYGLTVNMGGGEGWRHYMRRAIDGWNIFVAPNYWAAPKITRINYVAWDGITTYQRCTIDMDEVWDEAGSAAGGAARFYDNPHIAGGVVRMQTATWFSPSVDSFEKDYIAAHELQHAMGLGHNPYCDSVMHADCWASLTHNNRDRDTLGRMYSHKH